MVLRQLQQISNVTNERRIKMALKKYPNVSETTFSKSTASQYLVELLKTDEYKKYSHSVYALIGKAFQFYSVILQTPNPIVCEYALDHWYKENLAIIEKHNYPDKIKSNVRYFIVTRYRQCLQIVKDRYKTNNLKVNETNKNFQHIIDLQKEILTSKNTLKVERPLDFKAQERLNTKFATLQGIIELLDKFNSENNTKHYNEYIFGNSEDVFYKNRLTEMKNIFEILRNPINMKVVKIKKDE